MADYDKNAAYDLSLFETRKSAAAPEKKRPSTKPELVREKQQTRFERLAEAKNRKRILVKMTVICVVMVSLLGAVLQSRVEIVKNASVQAQREATLKASISEGVRLKSEINSLVSLENVERYALEHGMKKVERYQIIYVNPLKGDEIIKFVGKPSE